jgi:hypothetical protein
MKKHIFLLVFLSFELASCNSCKEQTPEPFIKKQVYRQFFECKVNGQLWKPDTPSIFWKPVDMKYSPYYGVFLIAERYSPRSGLTISTGPGLSFPPPSVSTGNIDTIGFYQLSPGGTSFDIGIMDTTKPHYLKITKIDTAKRIYEGEFAFTSYLQDTSRITEGKFGLIWRPY